MKKLALTVLILFFVTVIIVLLAALFFPKGKLSAKPGQSLSPSVSSEIVNKASDISQPVLSAVIPVAEVSKHNNRTDCWMIIEANVYNITPYFGMHPGGNQIMEGYCGQDASRAYQTQDGQKDHSAYARSLLKIYLIGSIK